MKHLNSVAFSAGAMSFAADGAPVDDAKRGELLASARAGRPVELAVTAEVFHQMDAPIPLPVEQREKANKNFSRFAPEQLDTLAASFVGRPLLRDHERHDIRAVAGEIVASEAVRVDGGVKFVHDLRVVSSWAVEGFLNGTIKHFSISADPAVGGTGWLMTSYLCSVCGTSLCDSGCDHMPGDVVEREDGDVVVEALLRDVVGAEVSGVAFPAVSGTEITDIRSELSQARANLRQKDKRMTDEIRVALELSEKAGSRDAVEAIAGLKAHNAKLALELAEAKQIAEGSEEALRAARDEIAARDAAAKAAEEALKASQIDALIERGYAEGRLVPQRNEAGEQIQSKMELAVRNACKAGIDVGEEYLNAFPRLTPAGAPPIDNGETAPPPDEYHLTAEEKRMCDLSGCSYADFRAANPIGSTIPIDNGSED